MRVASLLIAGVFLWLPLAAQAQGTAPSASGQSGSPAVAPDDQSKPAAGDSTANQPASLEQREKEIDKYDPLKKSPDTTNQNPNPLTDRQPPAAPPANASGTATPLPGSVAASNAQSAASQNGGSAQDALQDSSSSDAAGGSGDASGAGAYTGPAVLTRSYTLARPMIPAQLKWRVYVGLNVSTDSGQTYVAPNGGVPTSTLVSRSLTWGLSGRHLWRHDQLGVAYSGSYSDYSAGSLSGLNNSLNLDFAHVISRRLTIQLVQSLQSLSQNYGLENPSLPAGSSPADINLGISPGIQILDSSVRQSNSTVSLTYHETNRLSYDVSGSNFIIGYTGSGLTGMNGRQVSADANYRLTRKATVGAYYSYSDYLYSHNVSSSDSHGMGGIFSYSLDKSTQLRTRFGASRIESLSYEVVPLPPVLAVILGESSTLVNAYSLNWTSDISVQLVRDFRRNRTGSFSYVHGESPGNGILLTSTQQTISANYGMRLFRSIPLNASVTRSSLNSQTQGNRSYYNTDSATVGISRQIRPGIDASFSVAYLRYDIDGSPLLQHDLRFSLGIRWSPPENSLRF